jgi:hypothetical protein
MVHASSPLEAAILREYTISRRSSGCRSRPHKLSRRASVEKKRYGGSSFRKLTTSLLRRASQRRFSRMDICMLERGAFPKKSVRFAEPTVTECREFLYEEDEYLDFPDVPSHEYLEHDEYYEAMAEMVSELNEVAGY